MAVLPMQFDAHRHGLEYLEYYAAHKVYHPGIDLNKGYGNDDLNAPGFAIMNGVVEYVSPKGENGGLGLYCVLYFPSEGRWVRVLHLSEMLLLAGQKFVEGQEIMKVGKSGTSFAHMHIEGWNKKMYDFQKAYWKRKFGYYPSGESKAWVQERTFDVLEWIKEVNARPDKEKQVSAEVPDWAKKGVDFCLKNNLIGTINGRTIKDYELATILERFHNLIAKNDQKNPE